MKPNIKIGFVNDVAVTVGGWTVVSVNANGSSSNYKMTNFLLV